MRYLIASLAVCFIAGCGQSVTAYNPPPDNSYRVASRGAVCFHREGGTVAFASCAYGNECDTLTCEVRPESKVECEANVLVNYRGNILDKNTHVNVYRHGPDSESRVVVRSGDFIGEVMFCPTISLRKK